MPFPNDSDNIWRSLEINLIIQESRKKCQQIAKNGDEKSIESILKLLEIVSDASRKISSLSWTDRFGIQHGTQSYIQAIRNL